MNVDGKHTRCKHTNTQGTQLRTGGERVHNVNRHHQHRRVLPHEELGRGTHTHTHTHTHRSTPWWSTPGRRTPGKHTNKKRRPGENKERAGLETDIKQNTNRPGSTFQAGLVDTYFVLWKSMVDHWCYNHVAQQQMVRTAVMLKHFDA